MKVLLLSLIKEYLSLFPEETDRQKNVIQYLNTHIDKEIIDWNNFDGHVVVGGFIYAKKERKFLCLYHKDLKMYLYPGGHIDSRDNTILEAVKREIEEETGLTNLKSCILQNNPFIPIDIDTHIISYNNRLQLPSHYHFEFRYLFLIDEIVDIQIEEKELSAYKWICMKELREDKNYGFIAKKLQVLLSEEDNE